ncbi:hypothetical protein DYE49_02435 [Treponema rectale]|uniref:Uncharacterized protein n=1 Tax=Treponema rectale TaxID=744512 RepID=A0A7M1XIS8_9SPIR|nr:hypothetical protein DYE49_02435 [Treponema rectale]
MKEQGLYYLTSDFATMVKTIGGTWEDTKHRPVVCLVKSSENDHIYWAIPMGNLKHRTQEQVDRINTFLNYPERDIRSCYYHIGRTTAKSIFFISDAIPVTDDYIESEHLDFQGNHFIIKNPQLISELNRKLSRILAMENSRPNLYRQHITDIKKHLIEEQEEKNKEETDKSGK